LDALITDQLFYYYLADANIDQVFRKEGMIFENKPSKTFI
jgi:hypothetical protein